MARLFLVGFMASGKTTTGKRISKKYNLEFIDLDAYIEKRQFKTINQIFAEIGESGFRELERNMLREVAQFENVIIACGGGTPCFFDNMDIMNAAGDTVYLKTTPENLCAYLKMNGTAKRPLVKDKTDAELFEYVSTTLAKREPFYSKAKYTVASEDFSDTLYEQLLAKK